MFDIVKLNIDLNIYKVDRVDFGNKIMHLGVSAWFVISNVSLNFSNLFLLFDLRTHTPQKASSLYNSKIYRQWKLTNFIPIHKSSPAYQTKFPLSKIVKFYPSLQIFPLHILYVFEYSSSQDLLLGLIVTKIAFLSYKLCT